MLHMAPQGKAGVFTSQGICIDIDTAINFNHGRSP